MIAGFYKSRHWEKLVNAVSAVEKRGARESCIMLVTGVPGVGKTEAIARLAATCPSMYIRVPSLTNKKALMVELARTDPAISTKGSAPEIQKAIIRYVLERNCILILDECQHLLKGDAELLEAIRDITDAAQCICILVAGTADVESRIARLEQFSSRINRAINFEALTLADMPALLAAKCEIPLDPEVVAEFHRQSNGRMRLIMHGIVNLEQYAKRNGKKALSLADISVKDESGHTKPMQICIEWQASGKRGRQ